MAGPKEMVPVVGSTGQAGYLDPKFAPEAQRVGLRGATDRDLREAQLVANADATRADLNAQYDGTIEGAVAPALAGAARGVSLGGSDVALAQLGPGMRRRLLDYQEYAPGASMLGEVGGVAGAALLGDEAVLGRVPGLVGRLGAGAEAAVAGRLGGGVLARGAGLAARGATEGALYSTGKAAGDAALQNEQLTTEKALSAVGHGAVFGAGANVLLGGAGAGLSKLLSREEGAVAGLASRVEGGVQRESTGLGDTLQAQRDAHVFKALGGTKNDIMAAERNVAGGHRKVADDVFNLVEAKGGRMATQSKRSINEIVTEELEKVGERQGAMLKKLDELGGGTPDVKGITSKIQERLVTPHIVQTPTGPMVLPGKETGVGVAEEWIKKLDAAFGEKPPTFEQLHTMRRAVDEKVNWAKATRDPSQKAYAQIRSIMEDGLETSGEAAAKNVGGAFVGEYQAGKSLYQSLRIAKDLSDRGVAGQVNNNAFGLGSVIAAGTGVAAGGPLGGLAMGLAGKLVKDRGDMLAADLLHRAANLAGVQRLASQTDATMSRGIASLLGTKAITTGAETVSRARVPVAPLGVILSGDLHKDFDKVRAQAVQLQTNPAQLTDRVAKALGPEAAKSPGIATAVTNTMLGDVAYLNAKIPPPRTDAFTLQPQLQPPTRASDAEKHEYLEAAKALNDPTIMLRNAKAGSLTPVTVAAIKERRPEMYEAMRTEIFQSLTTSKAELPYGARVQLGILLDLPTDQTLAPDFVRDIQATYTASEKAGVEPPPPNPMTLDVSSSLMTSTQSAGAEGMDR